MVNSNNHKVRNIDTFIQAAQTDEVPFSNDLICKLYTTIDAESNDLHESVLIALLNIYFNQPWDYWGTIIVCELNEDPKYEWSIGKFVETLMNLSNQIHI
jgi:hypothetical protein